MGLRYNNTDITEVVYNGTALTQINFNGTPVWYALQSCSISGTAEVGSTLTATVEPSSVQSSCSFQWYRASASGEVGTAISGATSRTYTLADTDRTNYIYCIASIGNASVKSNYTPVIKGWISWSLTLRDPSDGSWTSYYPNQMSISYTIPSTVKVTSVTCTTWVKDHTGGNSPGSTTASLYVGGTHVATGSTGRVYDAAHVEASSSCSYSNSNGVSNQTVYGYDNLGVSNGGDLKRKIQLSLSGLQLA